MEDNVVAFWHDDDESFAALHGTFKLSMRQLNFTTPSSSEGKITMTKKVANLVKIEAICSQNLPTNQFHTLPDSNPCSS